MHILQPKHTKLNDGDTANLFKKYNILSSQLPKIKHTDSALEGLNVKKGDVIKIIRKEEEKEVEYFRVVV